MSERTVFWVGRGDDLQAVIDQAPAGSTIYSNGEHKGPIRMKSGVGIHGVSPEEYEARGLGHGARSMTNCVITLAPFLNEYSGPMHIAGACTCVGIRSGDPHCEGCPQRSRVPGSIHTASSQLP